MTRTLCSRSSRKKPSNLCLEVEKENVPLVPLKTKKMTGKNKNCTSTKENKSPNYKRSLRRLSVNSCNSPSSVIKNSSRKTTYNKNVLCDKTNTPNKASSQLDESVEVPVLQTVENKNKIVQTLICVPKPNDNIKNKAHVPVYKTVNSVKVDLKNVIPPNDKKEAIYEFEVDENEDSTVQKKRRKKRVYNKKPKIGPKALTINNIKYSSTESLASLPEKPVSRKKKTTKNAKANQKSFTSMTNLASTEESSCSVSSKSISHPPPLVTLAKNKKTTTKCELSIVLESPSALNTSHTASGIQTESFPQFTSITGDTVSRAPSPNLEENVYSNSWCPNPLPQASSCANNISTTSQPFLSSTPVKQMSAVVSNNSVFDDSYELPNSVRQSSRFNNSLPAHNTLDNCFGFDEPEELEEPLVSPIKNTNNREDKRIIKKIPSQPLIINELKPSAQEVIELLKASIPKGICKQRVLDVYDIESENQENSLPINNEDDFVEVNFRKPPRRSYERPQRIRHKSDTEEEESENEECKDVKFDKIEEKISEPKGKNRCYKRGNTTKSARQPKVTKAKQKIAKEEQEMERLAAMMNAQFQEIEKVSLVVE